MKCLASGCLFDTDAEIDDKATLENKLQLMSFHLQLEHAPVPAQPQSAPSAQPATNRRKPESFPRPKVGVDETREDWDTFELNWFQYKKHAELKEDEVSGQLVACCSKELQSALSRNLGRQQFKTEEAVLLKHMEQLAVEFQNPAVYVQEFLDIKQTPDEGIRHFLSRLKGVAQHCEFLVDCVCKNKVSYSDSLVKFKLVSGLLDSEIKEDILGGDEKSLEETVKAIEAKESAKRAKSRLGGRSVEVSRVENRTCFNCKGNNHDFTKEGQMKCPARDKMCPKCGIKGHYKDSDRCNKPMAVHSPHSRKPRSPRYEKRKPAEASEVEEFGTNSITAGELAGLMSVMTAVAAKVTKARVKDKAMAAIKVPHMLYDQLLWHKKSPPAHPTLNLEVSVSTSGYEHVGAPTPPATRRRTTTLKTLADTGCQACCMGPAQLHSLGLNSSHLLIPELNLRAANATGINILGAAFVSISGMSSKGTKWRTNQLVYVAEGLDQLILSKEACESLGLIERNFPTIGSYGSAEINTHTYSGGEDDLGGGNYNFPQQVMQVEEDVLTPCIPRPDGTCSCPRRELPPPPPPCPSGKSPDQMKRMIINHYAASSFNRCMRQALPQMKGEPMPIITDPNVKPVAVHRPVPVPLHWMKKVKEDLDQDVHLGIIEPVPINTPTSWCSRMVIVPKSSGEPRRTVDYKALNDASVRQTHHTKSPFALASEVPRGTVKSVLDVWNAYHSVPIRAEDKDKTTFITPWGRYRYLRAPQGYLSSGDGFTHRDQLTSQAIKNKVTLVDDNMVWDATVEENFVSVCKLLDIYGKAGLVMNSDKFQFGKETVNFAGMELRRTRSDLQGSTWTPSETSLCPKPSVQ